MSIRAVTLINDDPSRAVRALSEVFGWTIESDFGRFASVLPPSGIPVWINAPAEPGATTSHLVVHLATDDVDADAAAAAGRGARIVRGPSDIEYGERSAVLEVDGVPGVKFDFSHPLAR
ncbi:VOC family protein [Microlunatus sp. GCM10028923]|uniref:VOC family protein n=1 Tax=Microlunatus sp. GCM10028923 TaxID=3273400 RepID=UPI0036217E6E